MTARYSLLALVCLVSFGGGMDAIVAVPSGDGPSDKNSASDYRKPQFCERHELAPHDLIALAFSVFVAGAGFGGIWGMVAGLRFRKR